VSVQTQRRAGIVAVPLQTEDAAALGVENTFRNKLVDGPASLEGGIQLEVEIRPQGTAGQLSWTYAWIRPSRMRMKLST
jgi:hypothetical protein